MSNKNLKKIISVIDIGTNSVHLVIAKLKPDNQIEIVHSHKKTIQLGRYLNDQEYLEEEGIVKLIDTLYQLIDVSTPFTKKIRAVATHAIRVSKNSKKIIKRILKETGIPVKVIDGFQEACYTYLGVSYYFSLQKCKCLMVDIGGGSTEVLLGNKSSIFYVNSLEIGVVTLSKKHFLDSIPNLQQIENLKQDIDDHLNSLPNEIKKFSYEVAVASSGTAKALIKMCNNNFSSEKISSIREQLESIRCPQKIKEQFALSKRRAQVIMVGAIILERFCKYFQVKTWQFSPYNLREGVILESFFQKK